MNIKVSGKTDIGTTRENNEDSYQILPYKEAEGLVLLALVADGMGGLSKGEVASELIIECTKEFFEEESKHLANYDADTLRKKLYKLAQESNEIIYEYGEENKIKLGSTLALLLLLPNNEYIVMNIGDSRIYKFGKKAVQITKDQTLAQREVDRGNLTLEEAKTDKRSHTLLQCVGQEGPVSPDFFKGNFKEGDSFLLCSDGMYNRMERKQLESFLSSDKTVKETLQDIIEAVKETGEKDNITGVLIITS